MRPLWKGAVSFGLVFVPVKLYVATDRKDIKFNYLHEKCKTPVQYKRFCPNCNEEVSPEELVRGYEFEKGRYVVMKDEDFENLPGAAARSIDILDFVDLADIDPLYYDKAYYLAPAEGGQRVYELLKQAMQQTGKVAVARVVIRSKETLAALRVAGEVLSMSTMFYQEEVRNAGAIGELNYQVDIHDNELKMAVNLINNLSSVFEPQKYTNQYRQALMERIHGKVAGDAVDVPAAAPGSDKVVDLMQALKASIDLAKAGRKTGGQGDADKTTGKTKKTEKVAARKRKTS